MKELILEALRDYLDSLDGKYPMTKKVERSIDLPDDIMPIGIAAYMKANNVPDDAEFEGVDNGYDGFTGELKLVWYVEVTTDPEERLKYKMNFFEKHAFPHVYRKLTKNGYKRVGVNTLHLRNFGDFSIYDSMTNDTDRLVAYYSMYFVKD